MKKTGKKGFTIVELVVVIAVVAILAAVLIPTFVSVVNKANVSNDTSLVKNINLTLAAEEITDGKPATMHDALVMAERGGFDVSKLTPRSSGDIVWDSATNRFALVDKDGNKVFSENDKAVPQNASVWKIVDSASAAESESNYSVYLKDGVTADNLTVSTGIDVGNNTVSFITYNGENAAKEVIIRTNGGTLTVGSSEAVAKGQTYHYGTLNSAIIYTETNCFHTYGLISQLELNAGKVIAEDKGYVVLAKAKQGTLIEEKDTGVVYVPSEVTATDVDASVVSNLGYIVTADGTTSNPERETKSYYEISSAAELKAYRDGWNSGAITINKVKLTADIDISGENWYPIGNWEYPFYGTFDGNGKTLGGLYANSIDADHKGLYANNSVVGSGETFGFFGIVGNGDVTVKNLTFSNVNINIYDGKNVGTVIGYAPKNEGFIKNEYTKKWKDNKAIGTDKVILSDITVSGSVTGKNHIAGIAGKIYATGGIFVSNCVNKCNITAEKETAAGIIGYIKMTKESYVNSCTNNGNVYQKETSLDGLWCPGGIVGFLDFVEEENREAHFTDCHNSGEIKTDSIKGKPYGIIGNSIRSSQNTTLYVYFLDNCTTTGGIALANVDQGEAGTK